MCDSYFLDINASVVSDLPSHVKLFTSALKYSGIELQLGKGKEGHQKHTC
jgi:hypothetical protein